MDKILERIHDRIDKLDGRLRRVEVLGAFLVGLGFANLGIPLVTYLAG